MRLNTHMTTGGLLFLCLTVLCLFPLSSALASDVGYTLCWVYNYTVGSSNIARGIATLGVAAVALAAMFGKVSWGMAILVAVGISGLFGAGELYASFFPGTGSC